MVEGVGATGEPLPPVALVYHTKPVPVAVSWEAACPRQYVSGLVTTGGGDGDATVTVFDMPSLPQAELEAVKETVYVPGDA